MLEPSSPRQPKPNGSQQDTTLSNLPLGLQDPLLPSHPLGQALLQTECLARLGGAELTLRPSTPEILLSPQGRTALAAIHQIPETKEDKVGGTVEDNFTKISAPSSDSTSPNPQTSPETTVAQLLSEAPELLSLPNVLNDLTQIRPLGQSEVLGQDSIQTLQTFPFSNQSSSASSPQDLPTPIQSKPEKLAASSSGRNLPTFSITDPSNRNSPLDRFSHNSANKIPASWSSLAELIESSNSTDSNSTDSLFPVIQPHGEEKFEDLIFTPEGFQKAPRQEVKQEYQNQVPSNTSVTYSAARSQPPEQEIVSESNLDMLAREIYRSVRQRLVIERERYGR
ncbi:MAG TPA: hypothetical protein DDZ80_19775 [Cyanobacteria bacterium UBA8803]|nr:hypothetical protein [Cyanobacteria bacterium UBA9273]HBL60609.1 hypothetical protein [Cyanobacteria bacterium UBA8803]